MEEDKVYSIIEQFSKKVVNLDYFNESICSKESWKKYFLSSGYPEIVSFALDAKTIVKDVSFENLIVYCMHNIKKNISDAHPLLNLEAGILSGYCGIGYMSLHLLKNNINVKKLNESVNNRLKKILARYLNRAELNIKYHNVNYQDYDVLYGLSSSLRYLIEYKDEGIFDNLIEKIIKYLMKIIEDGKDNIPNYFVKPDNLSDYNRSFHPEGGLIYGVAHGIAGILSVLSIASLKGIEVEGLKECIERILEKLECKRTDIGLNLSCWPQILDLKDYMDSNFVSKDYSLGWCYGIMGTARAVYLGGQAIKCNKYVDISLKTMRAFSKSMDKVYMETPILCHGYAGILLILNSMYVETNIDEFKDAASVVVEKIINNIETEAAITSDTTQSEWYNSMDILEGIIGILFALINYKNPNADFIMKLMCIN